jgi:hypothetical protein
MVLFGSCAEGAAGYRDHAGRNTRRFALDPIQHRIFLQPMLPNCRQLSADGRDVPGLDERRRTQIDVAHVPEYTDDRDQGGAHKTNDHNLEMGPGVRAVK